SLQSANRYFPGFSIGHPRWLSALNPGLSYSPIPRAGYHTRELALLCSQPSLRLQVRSFVSTLGKFPSAIKQNFDCLSLLLAHLIFSGILQIRPVNCFLAVLAPSMAKSYIQQLSQSARFYLPTSIF